MIIEKLLQDWQKELYYEFDLQPAIDEIGVRKVLDVLLDNIGYPESYIRENVLEATGALTEMSVLSIDDYLHALNRSIPVLFKGIDEGENDDVFGRGFVSFVIAMVIYADAEQGFLSDEQRTETFDKAFEYMILEKDRRGFVYGKGTVHTICHGTSMIKAIIEHPKFNQQYTSQVLEAVKVNIVGKGRFTADDWADEFLVEVISALLNKGISEDIIKEWIESLLPPIPADVRKYTDEHYPYIQMFSDIRHFLMCLYFELKKQSMNDGLREWIFEYLPTLQKKTYLHIR